MPARARVALGLRRVPYLLSVSSARGQAGPGRAGAVSLRFVLVFEGYADLGAVGLDLPVLDLEVEFHYLGDAQVTQATRGAFHSGARSVVPGFGARANQFDNLVDAIRHRFLPFDPIDRLDFILTRDLLPWLWGSVQRPLGS
ncbi:hypothetical protein BQ8794_630001 [Mesorhizobium prunaredense]|uniref:Uncharacterized protein n=1 Tax=Mesorhizobium prunaredense TaxID=1631249 RepID=A0A1R3VGL0_9HYPH|nr:hypothetical protein BQ8794_630001 [Mesorhizobium prunaredense]